MKIFQNKNLFKKLIIVLLFITIFSFCMPKVSRADDLGGKLLNPIMSFFVALGDGTMTIIQKMVLQIDESVINIDTSSSFWAKALVIIAAVVVVSVIVAATVLTAGAAGAVTMAGIATALKGIAAAAIVIGVTTVTFPVTTQVVEGMLPDSFILPMYEVTPQEIFSNKIPLLDVDFFHPMDDKTYTTPAETKKVKEDDTTEHILTYIKDELKNNYGYDEKKAESMNIDDKNSKPSKYVQKKWDYGGRTYVFSYCEGGKEDYLVTRYEKDGKNLQWLKDEENDSSSYGRKLTWDDGKNSAWRNGNAEVSIEGNEKSVTVKEETSVTVTSTAKELRTIVANWYNILRDIALVALLSVLVYVGIRILLSATSGEKAKYKQMLVDWLVAICLLFLMQYIMSFSNMLVKKIIEIVDTANVSATKATEIKEPNLFVITDKKKVKKAYEVLVGDGGEENAYYKYFLKSDFETPAGSKDNAVALAWPAENFMQQARLNAQLREVKQDKDGNYDTDEISETYVAIGWKLIFVVLVVYTVIFIFTYVKRVLYMAFLTMIAPLVALTYPIDKMNDGKAQAFDMWFKEYIFNLLIQPLHLILYTVLIGSAVEFASKNIIYVVVALGFMTPAEKLMRRFFGFEKAHTPGLLGGPAGAAIMMSGMNKLLGKRSDSKSSGSSSNGGSEDGDEDKSSLRFNDNFDKTGAILGKGPQDFQDKLEDNKEDQKLIDLQKRKEEAENEIKQNGAGKKEAENDLSKIDDEMKRINDANNKKTSGTIGEIPTKDNPQLSKGDQLKRKIKLGGKSLVRAGRYYGHKKLSNVGKKIENSHPFRTGLKMYGGLAAGTAGAILGGIAGGDPTKAFQYGVAGATGGYKAMDAILPEMKSDEDYKNANELRKETYYGDNYDNVKLNEYVRRQKHDYDNRVKIETALGSKKSADEFIKNDMGEYMKNGVTDIDEMMTLNSMVQDGTFSDRDMAIATRKYAKRAGSKIGNMKQKDQDEWHTTFAKEFRKNPRLKKENLDADKEADKVIKLTNTYFDRMNKEKLGGL